MASSRIAENLKSARERMGWSREALAYHSGLSWSAIAQIESGRRQEIRVSSLVALASALGVSVDYLVGGAATVSPHLLGHKVLIYSSDDEFLASAVPFLTEGVERSEAVLAVPAAWQLDLLRDALGDAAHHVEFLESAKWYDSLRGASRGYLDFVRDRFVNGASWIRILGDAAWLGRADAPVVEWFRYEFDDQHLVGPSAGHDRVHLRRAISARRRAHGCASHAPGSSRRRPGCDEPGVSTARGLHTDPGMT